MAIPINPDIRPVIPPLDTVISRYGTKGISATLRVFASKNVDNRSGMQAITQMAHDLEIGLEYYLTGPKEPVMGKYEEAINEHLYGDDKDDE